MGCDYYIINKLVFEYSNTDEKDIIQLSRDRGYCYGNYTIDECIEQKSYEEIIYEHGKWLINNEDMIELYSYLLETNNINWTYLTKIIKVKSGER